MNEAEALNPESQEPTPEVETLDEPQVDETAALIAKLTSEREGLMDELLRTRADLQNFRRRTEQEKIQVRQMATEDLVTQLLPVLDNFDRALTSVGKGASLESVVEGIRMVERQLRSALESQRVTKIDSVGQPFDPAHHEAIATEHSDEHEEGTILHELEAGYKMADRVIRPARVKVVKKN